MVNSLFSLQPPQPTLPVTGSDGQGRLYVVALMLLVGGLLIRRTRTAEQA